MRKLTLKLDDLLVDTFETTRIGQGEGDGVRRAVHVLHAVHLPRMPDVRELQHLRQYLQRIVQRHLRVMWRIVQWHLRGLVRRVVRRHLQPQL